MTLTLFDSIYPANIPATAQYAAGYVGGSWPTYANGSLRAHLPNARLLSIAVSASENAECLDIESRDAVNSQAPAWVRRQQARGVKRPVLYTSAGNVGALVNVMSANGLNRFKDYLIWSAHYTSQHICAPGSCGYPQADGTQWTSAALGRSLDESALEDGFFTFLDGSPQIPPAQQTGNATIKQGDSGPAVTTAQLRLIAWHVLPGGSADGAFGPKTALAVRAFQDMMGLAVDGIVGPGTWTALNKNPNTFTYPAPTAVTAHGGRTSSFQVSWSTPLHFGQPLPAYQVYVYDVTGNKPTVAGDEVHGYPRMSNPGTNSFSGGSLVKGHEYIVHVVACAADGSRARPGVFGASPKFTVG